MQTTTKGVLLALLTISLTTLSNLQAEDWPSWRGPRNDGVSSESLPNINKMKVLWEKNIGLGYTAVTTKKNKLYVMGHNGEPKRKAQETLYCLNADTGEQIWTQSYSGALLPSMHTGGPNATPLITDEHIYLVSKDGKVQCRTTIDGKLVWQTEMLEVLKFKFPKNPATMPNWGFASSPIIFNDMLLVSNGITVALNPVDGKEIWTSDKYEKAAYATPMPFTVKGRHYAAIMTGSGVNIISLEDGKTLDHYPMSARFNMLATTPILIPEGEGEFFASTSNLSVRLYFSGSRLESRWVNKDMKNKFTTSVHAKGHLFGIDGGQGSRRAAIVALNALSGDMKWKKTGTGHGTIVGAKDGFLFLSDDGELISFERNTKEFKELGRRKVLEKICWTTPTLSNGKLYVRNDQGRLICFSE